tara:strand:- start:32848 stop:34119 length:1272 start_codon:yes stop_codon:yes gene_type:complete
MKSEELLIAVIGLGYVGLPLAVEFGKKREVIGFDINKERIEQLKNYDDTTLEVTNQEIKEASNLSFSSSTKDIADCNCYIVTVPTPINEDKTPDLGPIHNATQMIANVLKKGDLVIYESTVYPGTTEEYCVPILEKHSKLVFNKDFYCGYSPERINPGDKKHRLTDIVKVTSGSNEKISNLVDSLYKEIIVAGTHKADSIKIAEAAKVIENTQRDINIALINELAIIFNKMNIDTNSVLDAAGTKWNFLPFKPGLVGGHCIGVDPYYLTYKAELIGYEPKLILAGRKLNDSMGEYLAELVVDELTKKSVNIKESSVLIMGLSFKENCPDHRNTKVIDIYNHLKKYNIDTDLYDNWVDHEIFKNDYGIEPINNLDKSYNALIIAVAHDEYKQMHPNEFKTLIKKDGIILDVKSILPDKLSDIRL